MPAFYTDAALKIAARDKGVTCKADSGWNEYRVTAPGVAVVAIDRGHTKEDRIAARGEAWAVVCRMAAELAAACPTCNGTPAIQVAPGVVCSCPDCGPHARNVAPAVDVAEVRESAMRASVPALRAAGASLARQMETATGAAFDALAIRARIVADVAELKAGAIPGELAAAFALNVRPAEYHAPVSRHVERLALAIATAEGESVAELAADMAPDAREIVATRAPGGRWTLARAGVAAGFAALALASPASAEIAAGHFHAAPGTLADIENRAAELVAFVTGGGLFAALAAVALAGPVAVALVGFLAGRS